MRPTSFLCGVSSLSFLLGCTSASFDVVAGGDEDGGASDTGAALDGASFDSADAGGDDTSPSLDSAPADSGVPPDDGAPPVDSTPPPIDGAPIDSTPIDVGPPTCASLPSGATDVYVDKRFSGGFSTGTAACPFTTITAGLAAGGSFVGTRTVHVAGGTVPVIYNEASSLFVNHNVILVGDGPAKTTINASGTCGSGTCAVMVEGGATLDGFTVLSASGDGILTTAVAPPPIVKNVNANGSKLNGISSLGSLELGPNVSANRNGLQGLFSTGSGTVHVNAPTLGGANTFDNNNANGIDVEGNATLKFDGGQANLNNFNGVRLSYSAPTAGTGPNHVITGLTAIANKGTGIAAYNGQNLKLRASKLITNGFYGLFYQYLGTSTLDLGVLADLGGDTFGGTSGSLRNSKAGLFLCKSHGAATQPAEGDTWGSCAPTQVSVGVCDTTPGSYVDVAYAPAVAGDPIVATTCTIGP